MNAEKTNYTSRPHVSVIIPTTGNRQKLLARAINSAGAQGYDIEIFVVVNGARSDTFQLPDHSFEGVIHVVRLDESGVSNARNVGLSLATGVLVRFLDDDDYLLPEFAEKQYACALDGNATVVSGLAQIEDQAGRVYGVSCLLNEDDPYCDLLSASMVVLPVAHVFKLDAVKHLRWDVTKNNAEDVDWLHCVAGDREQVWRVINEVVGVWYQHPDGDRLSYVSINDEATKVSAEAIMRTRQVLVRDGRSTPDREFAAALGLWRCAHKAFYLSPMYWSKIIRLAMMLDQKVLVCAPLFDRLNRFGLHPILVNWVMIPKRILNHFWRMARFYLERTAHVRRF